LRLSGVAVDISLNRLRPLISVNMSPDISSFDVSRRSSMRDDLVFRRRQEMAARRGQSRNKLGPSAAALGRCVISGIVACLASTAVPLGAAAADHSNGKAIAERWCAACHLVSPDQKQANTDVPSFAAIAHKRQSPEKLRSFLMAPHPKMPDMNLSRQDVTDLVAYIESFKH
jgi:mono/diheme cytochrome c family protein